MTKIFFSILLIIFIASPGQAGDSRKNYTVTKQALTIPTSGSNQAVLALFNPSTSTRRALIDSVLVYHETGSGSDGIRWSFRRNATFTSSGTIQSISNPANSVWIKTVQRGDHEVILVNRLYQSLYRPVWPAGKIMTVVMAVGHQISTRIMEPLAVRTPTPIV